MYYLTIFYSINLVSFGEFNTQRILYMYTETATHAGDVYTAVNSTHNGCDVIDIRLSRVPDESNSHDVR